jgi:gamma-glutamyl-gamma-aminobutyrate hydrolase PuuD
MKRPVTYVSDLESDGSIQAKAKNISFSDTAAVLSEEVNINDAVELSKGSDEIEKIIKADADVYMTNLDVLNDKMLVEGICKVGFLFTENNDLHTVGYVSEEFPFTHYLEFEDLNENMLKDISIEVKDMTYSTGDNFDDEKKLIEFALPFTVSATFYSNIKKNIITDCYSTDYELDLLSEKINLSSIKKITDELVPYENSFEVPAGSIRDVYSADVSPKVSEKRIAGNKYIIDGFLDVNVLYLNGDMNKMDKAFASLPFTASFPIDEEDALSKIYSDLRVHKCNAYRKGNKSVNISCEINVGLKFKDDDDSIYDIPLLLEREGLAKIVCERFNIKCSEPDLSEWTDMTKRAKNQKHKVNIGLVGKYVELKDAYLSVAEALKHAGIDNSAEVDIAWIQSEDVNEENYEEVLKDCDGILVPGGFGDRGIEGKILAAKYARENKKPYLGICLGMQIAVIEFARSVLGYTDANSSEFNPKSNHAVIDIMEEQKEIGSKGGTMRLGSYPCKLIDGTKTKAAYGDLDTINERHRHRYEFNNKFREECQEKGLIISGLSPDNKLVEIIELKDHPWFVGCQFHPEFKSRPTRSHPLFKNLIKASIELKK